MKKHNIIVTLLSVSLLSGCATAQKTSVPMSTDAIAKKGVEASEKAVMEAIKGFKEKYKVEQGIDPEVLTHYLDYDKEIIKEVKVDNSKVKWETPGTYEAIYTIEAVLPEKEDATIEVTEKVPVQIMTPEEVEEDKKNGGDAISKEEFEADKAENNKKPEQTETAKPSEDNKKPETEDNVEESNPAEDNKKPESNTTKPSGSKPEINTGTSKPTTSNKPAETKPSHTHSWEAQYKTVQHAEIGHNEQYVIKEAWTEYVPNYVLDEREICNGCGADMTGWSNEQVKQHTIEAVNAGNMLCGGWHSEFIQIQIGTTPVNHPAEYGTRYVVDKSAWTEKVLTGYKCSCGATKN